MDNITEHYRYVIRSIKDFHEGLNAANGL